MKRLRYDRVIAITVCVGLASLIIGLAVLTEVKRQLVEVSTESYKRQQALVVNQTTETLSNNVVNIENQLRVIATMQRVRDISDPDTCDTRLTELLQIGQKQLGNLGRTDPQGYFACSANPALIGQDSARYGSYVHDLINDPRHRPAMSRLKKPAGSSTYTLGLHVPVYQDGQFYGTVGGAIYFDRFQDNYLKNVRFGNNGYVVLVDDNGDMLYHPSDTLQGRNLLDPKVLTAFAPQARMKDLVSEIRAGHSGEFDYRLEGVDKIGIFKSFRVADLDRHWAVIATIPVEDLNAAIDQTGLNHIFHILVGLFSVTTALLTFISLRNVLKNKELQRVKDDFISITSHQLRTPATIVKQNLGIVRGGFIRTKKERDQFIDAAYQSNENQLSIIENILSASKLEAGRLKLHKEPLELRQLVGNLTDSLRMSLKAKGHKLRLKLPDEPLTVNADPTLLRMALENLLSNAIKYTPDKGAITVTLSRQRRNALITVADTGKGMSADDIKHLFQRFYRLHGDEAAHVPGTGLGLYLTKKIVGMHHGRISVESKEKKGSSFTIRLPLS